MSPTTTLAAVGPNWLVITGLLFALYGAVMLAGAVHGVATWSTADLEARRRAAEQQRVSAWYGGVLLAAGFGLQALAPMATAAGPAVVAGLLLGLVAYLTAYVLALDAAGNRPASALGARADDERRLASVATEVEAVRGSDMLPAAAKLRVAG